MPQIVSEQRMRGICDKCIDIKICGNLITFWYKYKLIPYSICMCSKRPDDTPCTIVLLLLVLSQQLLYQRCCGTFVGLTWLGCTYIRELLGHRMLLCLVGLSIDKYCLASGLFFL